MSEVEEDIVTGARWPPSCLMVLEGPYWLLSHEWGVLATKGTLFCQLWGLVPSRGSETFQSENRQLTGWEVAINRGAGRMLAEGLFTSSSI